MALTRTAAVAGRRACAVLAVCSAVLHGLMIGHTTTAATAVLVLAMMAACVYCARDLWVVGSMRAWFLVALMNLGMVAVHMSGAGHHHGASVQLSDAAVPSTLMTAATAISAVEVVIAAGVLFYRTRGRATQLALGRRELA